MKLIKTLGLAAVAALTLAVVAGAGTASATVLCKTATSPCNSIYAAGTKVEDKTGTEAETTAFVSDGIFSAECQRQMFEASIANAGSSTETVVLSLAKGTIIVDFCTPPHRIIITEYGSFEIHYTGLGEGTVTAGGIKLTYEDMTTSTRCRYQMGAGTHFGTLYGGTEPTIQVDTSLELTQAENRLCGAEMQWEGEFEITTPTPLYVAKS